MITLFPSRQVVLELFGFGIHWYGVMYFLAFVLGYYLLGKLQRYRSLSLSKDDISTLLTWTVLGVVVGGRLGYVLLYEYTYFMSHPLEILFVWNGGMSSHGGFLGVALALAFVLHTRGVPILRFLDVLTVPVALGLALGRFGNFINLELYGTVTDVSWAMAIPGVEGLRHPTFFYALGKNLLIALLCYYHLRRHTQPAGMTFALFLILYGVLRMTVEVFREQTYALTDLGFLTVTRGQLLSLPIVVAGFILVVWLHRK